MKLHLHIGTEKTGTQTLQKYLAENRHALRSQGYALLESPGVMNARKLVAYCQDEDQFDDFFKDRQISDAAGRSEFNASFLREFEAEIAQLPPSVHTVVMSSEHFHSRLRSTDSIGRLKSLLASHFEATHIICFFREQSQVVQGLYSTAVKSGFTGEYSAFEQNCQPSNHYYNYLHFFSKWQDAFGSEHLKASLFPGVESGAEALCAEFCRLIGLSMTGLTDTGLRANQSLGVMGIETGRLINQTFPRYLADGSLNRLRIELMQQLERTPIARRGHLQSPQRMAIYQRFDESNREFARKFLGLEGNPFACPEGAPTTDSPDALTVPAHEVLALISQLLGTLAAAPRLTGQDVALLAQFAESLHRAGQARPAVALMDVAVRASGHNQALGQRLAEYRTHAQRGEEGKSPTQTTEPQ